MIEGFNNFLVRADKGFDYVPIASTVTNFVVLVQKILINYRIISEETVTKSQYYTHLKNKHIARSIFLLIPVIGNIIIPIYDFDQKKYSNRDYMLKAVGKDGDALCFASTELKADGDIVLKAVKQNGLALKYASADLKADRNIVLNAVQQNGLALEYASTELQGDENVVCAAFKEVQKFYNELDLASLPIYDLRPLQFATNELKNNKVFMKNIRDEYSWGAVSYAGEGLKNDEEFILDTLQKYFWTGLMYAGDELKNNKVFILKAVKISGSALEYVRDDFKNDIDVVTAAINKNIGAFRYASSEIRGNKPFVLNVLDTDPSIFEYVTPELKDDSQVAGKAIKKYPDLIRFASLKIQKEFAALKKKSG
jgi:hypothetical protein